jgi:RNA polymerase sigma-32 factor
MSNALAATTSHLPRPTNSLEAYIQAVSAIPALKAGEEAELARRLRYRADLDAAQQLIMAHLRFVVQIARGYQGYGLPLGDLIQEGNIGLMKAVRRFDPEQEVRLVSFAVHWVRAEIHEYVLRNWRIVKVATTKAQRKLFFNLRSAKSRLGWLSRNEAEAVADHLGVDVASVHEMESRLAGQDISFDPHPQADDDQSLLAPAGFLEGAEGDPARLVEEQDSRRTSSQHLSNALAGLDERSRDIVSRRWLEEPKATLQELAANYGVSAERIRQIEKKALESIRGSLLPA